MERLLHYVWKHRLFPLKELTTTDGQTVEVVDTGLHNSNSGPDFFNAKVKIGGEMWVGNVEIHDHSKDWYRHGHDTDKAYDNVILHVVEEADDDVTTSAGRKKLRESHQRRPLSAVLQDNTDALEDKGQQLA